jgi:predicted methyltransferase
MKPINVTTALAAALLTAAAPLTVLAQPAVKASAAVQAALGDPARPAEDKARDAARKPAELLALAGVKPGDKVADLIMGGGYLTRVLAGTVGAGGKVYAYQPAEFIAFMPRYGEQQKTVVAAYPNVAAVNGPLGTVSFPEKLDAVITVQNYHDLHLKPMPAGTAAKVNKAVFDALKPGGVYLIVDHAAVAGAPIAVADSLHRIDQTTVKSEVQAAGFKLERESPLYRDKADPKTGNVFDPAIRGKTDQFTLVFRKPR